MTARARILVIEDEPAIADTLVYALKTEGFEPHWCATGGAGLAALAETEFTLVILDIGLPDGSGLEFCKRIRARSAVPVLFLSARAGEIDRVLALEIGGDDYVTKPFSPREITARVKAILRRTTSTSSFPPSAVQNSDRVDAMPHPATCNLLGYKLPGARGELLVDEARCCITYGGVPLLLTRYEFRLLKTLAAQPGRVFSRDQLMTSAWEDPGASLDRTVDAHIKTLRAKLRVAAPEIDAIQTHRGMGYSLRPEVGAP